MYKKQPYSVSSAPDETIHQLKEKLEALTMLPVSNQKLMLKGLIKDDNVTLKEAGINEHSKLLLIGSTSGEIAKVQATDPESKLPFERRKPNGKVVPINIIFTLLIRMFFHKLTIFGKYKISIMSSTLKR